MEDEQILALYFARKEQAIAETARKYGALCSRIAGNILSLREDAEECVNDTYHAAWTRIPPERPRSLSAFLGRITRNLAISRYRANHAQKRYSGMEILLSELNDCVPAPEDMEQIMDRRQLSARISQWLEALPEEDRRLFLRRYWYGDSVADLALEWGRTPGQISQTLLRLRRLLRAYLEKEGISL